MVMQHPRSGCARPFPRLALLVAACLTLFNNIAVIAPVQAGAAKEKQAIQTAPLTALFDEHFIMKPDKSGLSRIVFEEQVKAPAKLIMEVLADFPSFPNFMKRVESVKVVRQEGNLYLTQAFLKHQMFVSERENHTITQVGKTPNSVEWALVDGNFQGASGRWEVTPVDSNNSKLTYTVALDPGVLPPMVVKLAMRVVQSEVIHGVKDESELRSKTLHISAAPTVHSNH